MKIAIYGAGDYGRYVYDQVVKDRNANILISCWIDNFRQEDTLNGLTVYTESLFFQVQKDKEIDAIVVAVRNHGKKMIAQDVVVSLLMRGYTQIYVALPELFGADVPVLNESGDFNSFVKYYKDMMPIEKLMLSLVVNRCNLNCKRCAHYSNLVREDGFLDLGKFESYLVQLRKKFRNIIEFQLLGGEPLLIPQLDSYIVLTRKYFPATRIVVVTNGLLISKMSSQLIDTIVRNNASFFISQYPPTRLHLERIVNLMVENRIDYELSPPRKEFRKWITLKEETGEKAFDRWKQSDCICHVIDEGRIYLCPCIPKLYAAQEYLGLHIEEEELMNSSIDLMSDEIDGWDILKYCAKAAPLCRFCSPDEVLEKWETGQPDKTDWFAD